MLVHKVNVNGFLEGFKVNCKHIPYFASAMN